MSPADLPAIAYGEELNYTIQRGQDAYKISFEPGQRIFVLPSPVDLPEWLEVRDVDKIPRENLLVAEIVSCCSLKRGETTVDFLKVIVCIASHFPSMQPDLISTAVAI